MEVTSIPRILSFGIYEADLRVGELYRAGMRVRLQEQPFRILAALLERPGDLVTRDELRLRLWPEDTFVDFDHGLNTAIKKLRQALQDDPRNPLFVQTLPRRGYRFIAPVAQRVASLATAVEEVAAPATDSSTPVAPPLPAAVVQAAATPAKKRKVAIAVWVPAARITFPRWGSRGRCRDSIRVPLHSPHSRP